MKSQKWLLMPLVVLMFPVWMEASVRTRECLWRDWLFIRENIEGAERSTFDDSTWEQISLPHDASISGAFQKSGDGASSRSGFRTQKRGWYRRHLAYDNAWRGKRVVLEFEGVYRDAQVYVNGMPCGEKHPNGYLDFEVDITEKLTDGDNVVAVSYDNSYVKSSRWYNGEGINRDVWLHVLHPLHVARYGTFVTTPKNTTLQAVVEVATQMQNELEDSVRCRLVTDVYAPDGQLVASQTAVAPFAAAETYEFRQKLVVPQPQLWQVGEGKMYKAVSRVFLGDEQVDEYETPFGIREIEMTPDRGLLVNGERVYVNGVCLHADLGPLGTASYEAAWKRRLEAVTSQLGCNAIRLAHNPFPRYVLDWADRNGVLVFDEMLDKWDESFYGKGVKMGWLQKHDMTIWLQRDRNHPSVFVWSVGNEVYQQIEWEKTCRNGVDMLKELVALVRGYDATRPVTVGQYPNRFGSVNRRQPGAFAKAEPHPFEFYTDVVSTNYLERYWDRDHQNYPQLVLMESEMAVGDLGYDFFNFDHSYPVGQFYWGGTDYIGESFGWPSKGWTRGLIDFTNHLKPLGWSVRSFYTTEPMTKIVVRPDKGQGSIDWNDLHMTWIPLETHWNYQRGDTLQVQVMSNCEETELLLNGHSLGRKQLPPSDTPPELLWQVPYEQGTLRAVGYSSGKSVSDDVLMTSGQPAQIVLKADADAICADGRDLVYIDCLLLDRQGLPASRDAEVSFSVSGQGMILATASDDMLSSEPWQGVNRRTTSHARCQLIVQGARQTGSVTVTAKGRGLKSAKITIPVW